MTEIATLLGLVLYIHSPPVVQEYLTIACCGVASNLQILSTNCLKCAKGDFVPGRSWNKKSQDLRIRKVLGK